MHDADSVPRPACPSGFPAAISAGGYPAYIEKLDQASPVVGYEDKLATAQRQLRRDRTRG